MSNDDQMGVLVVIIMVILPALLVIGALLTRKINSVQTAHRRTKYAALAGVPGPQENLSAADGGTVQPAHILDLEEQRARIMSGAVQSSVQGYTYTQPAVARPAQGTLMALQIMSRLTRFEPEAGKHILISGGSGSGKTALTMALIKEFSNRPGFNFLVIDTDAQAGQWGDIEPLGAKANYTEVTRAFDWLLQELNRRYEVRYEHGRLSPLVIVIEEFNSLARRLKKQASTFLEEMSSRGRKAQMYCIFIGQSNQVASLGLEGKGDLRGNFSQIWLGEKAVEALGQIDWPDPKYPAAIQFEGAVQPIDTSFVLRYQSVPVNTLAALDVSFLHVPNIPITHDLLISEPENVGNGGNGNGGNVGNVASSSNIVAFEQRAKEERQIKALIQEGWNSDKIALFMGGKRATRLEQIRQLRATLQTREDNENAE